MEIIAEITRPGFAKLSIGDYSLCPLSEGSQGGVREAAVAALADLPAMPDLVAQNCQLTLSGVSDNVGAVKHFLSVLTRALRGARHFALVEGSAIPTKARS